MHDPNPPDTLIRLAQLAQPSSDKGADAPVFCEKCGWRGTWRTCVWTDEGSFEEGYWREPHCPNYCDDEAAPVGRPLHRLVRLLELRKGERCHRHHDAYAATARVWAM